MFFFYKNKLMFRKTTKKRYKINKFYIMRKDYRELLRTFVESKPIFVKTVITSTVTFIKGRKTKDLFLDFFFKKDYFSMFKSMVIWSNKKCFSNVGPYYFFFLHKKSFGGILNIKKK